MRTPERSLVVLLHRYNKHIVESLCWRMKNIEAETMSIISR